MYHHLLRLIESFFLLFITCCLSGCTTPQVSKSSSSQPMTKGGDYRKLEQLLLQKEWQTADHETFRQLLALSDRREAGWLRVQDVESISCQDWGTINRLWQKYSERRFGFSIQARIWESAGGKVGQYDPEIVLKVGEILDWRDAEQWKQYSTLNFSLQANPGHLPATTGNGISGGLWGGIATLTGRVQACASMFDLFPKFLESADRLEVQQNQQAIQTEPSCIGCNLMGADLQGIDLTLKNLAHADLRHANLEGALLGATNLKLADLRGANLKNTVLRQANLWGASFDDANLDGADLSCGGGSCTSLQGSSFKDASLVGANFACLDCTLGETQGLLNVNLAGANLTHALVTQTSFDGVNLCNAILPNGKQSAQGC